MKYSLAALSALSDGFRWEKMWGSRKKNLQLEHFFSSIFFSKHICVWSIETIEERNELNE